MSDDLDAAVIDAIRQGCDLRYRILSALSEQPPGPHYLPEMIADLISEPRLLVAETMMVMAMMEQSVEGILSADRLCDHPRWRYRSVEHERP